MAIDVNGQVRQDQLGIHAGSLTYAAFLAIPPLLILGLSAVSLVLADDVAAQRRFLEAATSFIPGLDEVISSQFTLATTTQLGLGIVGVLALLWAISSFAARTRTALGVIFRTGLPTLLSGRLSGTLIGIPALIGLGAVGALARWAWALDAPIAVGVIVAAGVFAIGVGLFTVIYWALTPVGPDRPTLRAHLPGAVLFVAAAVGLERLGAVYVQTLVARATALYGAIGAIFGVLAFLYVTMWAFLLGAELSELVRQRHRPSVAVAGDDQKAV
jgi:membrane protein